MKVKSLFLSVSRALLPAVALAVLPVSCSQSDDVPQAVVRQPLAFQVSGDGQPWGTRGTPLDAFTGERGFGVLCTEYTQGVGGASTMPSMLMYNELVDYDGAKWTTENGYFIPETTQRMKFYAYYPYYADAAAGEAGTVVSLTADDEVTAPAFNYVTPDKAEDQHDLMFAVSDEVSSRTEGMSLVMDPVPLRFHHLLGVLRFRVESSIAGKVTRVAVSRVKSTARFVFSDAVTDWAQVYDGDSDPVKTVWQNLNEPVGESSVPVIITREPDVFMLLPQTLGSDNVVTITLEAGGNEFTLTKALPADTRIVKGHKTNVNVTISSLQQIELSVTNPIAIDDWNNTNINGEASDNTGIDPLSGIDSWTDSAGDNWDTTPTDSD